MILNRASENEIQHSLRKEKQRLRQQELRKRKKLDLEKKNGSIKEVQMIKGDKKPLLDSPHTFIKKPYSFARSTIDFSIQDLENSSDEDESFEAPALPILSQRFQPKRSCTKRKALQLEMKENS